MPVRHVDQEFDLLHRKVAEMAALVDRQFTDAVRALLNGDAELAAEVQRRDDGVDRMELDIDRECERLLARFQPVAVDLRLIITAIKVNTDLERIGDHCKNMAKTCVQLKDVATVVPHARLSGMAGAVRKVFQSALDSFLHRDAKLARQVLEQDQEVDVLHRENFDELVRLCAEHPEHAEAVTHLLIASKGLERIADHASNIAEDVIFLMEGVDVRHPRLGTVRE